MTMDDYAVAADPALRKPPENWQKPPHARRAVVVKSTTVADAKRATLQRVFPEHYIIPALAAVLGKQFDVIVMLWRPVTTHEHDWVDSLRCRLAPGAVLDWLV